MLPKTVLIPNDLHYVDKKIQWKSMGTKWVTNIAQNIFFRGKKKLIKVWNEMTEYLFLGGLSL